MQDLSGFSVPKGFRGGNAIKVQLWWAVQATLFAWSPQVLYRWRAFLLRLFGAKIGKNCRIHVCTNIGRAISHGEAGAPIIGDNVYIGPGVKMFGKIKIGHNTAIGANSVVNKSFEEGNCTIAGVPAKKISDNTSESYILGDK